MYWTSRGRPCSSRSTTVGGGDVVHPLRVALEVDHDVVAVLRRGGDGDRLGGCVSHGVHSVRSLGPWARRSARSAGPGVGRHVRRRRILGWTRHILARRASRPAGRGSHPRARSARGEPHRPMQPEAEHRRQHPEGEGRVGPSCRRDEGHEDLGAERAEQQPLHSGRRRVLAGEEEQPADADLVGAAALDGEPVAPEERSAPEAEEHEGDADRHVPHRAEHRRGEHGGDGEHDRAEPRCLDDPTSGEAGHGADHASPSSAAWRRAADRS